MRHRVCHHRRLVVHGVGGKGFVGSEEVGRDVEVLLEGEFGVGVAEEGESRHFARLRGPAQRRMRARGIGSGRRGREGGLSGVSAALVAGL